MVDISTIGGNSLRLKGKKTTFIVDPVSALPKTSADAVIFLNGGVGTDISRVADFRVVINGPGGYEVGGVKISGTKTPKGIIYRFSIDGVNIILGSLTDTKMEGFDACQVAIVNTDSDFNGSFLMALEPKIAILYGDKKSENAKALGAANVSPVSKITILKDKLPEKMEVVVLG